METELCAYSVEAVRTAARLGATRVELCASPTEGGTTPSAATIAMAREVAGERAGRPLELSVMIRPRGGDFLYDDEEFEQMRRDIAFAKNAGADGVVFGLLTPEGEVDVTRTRELVNLAMPMESTFHRAIDVARDPVRALEDIVAAGCRRVLTSGGRATALEGIDTIREMVRVAAGRIEIMAGSGVNPANGRTLAATGVDALHFSARAVREGGMEYRSPHVSFSPEGSSDHQIAYADPGFVEKMVEIAKTLKSTI
ncbi:MAG: copper homeostasis protein CutC [Alistipes sp.]|nr:copper homeostasis protein CutC [Alistipes sp.]